MKTSIWTKATIAAGVVSLVTYGQATQPTKQLMDTKAMTAPAKPVSRSAAPRAAAPGTSLETIVDLVKAGSSESMIIQILRKEGKVFNLGGPDLLKLQRAGVSESIVKVMMDPKAEPPPPPPPPVPAAVAPVPIASVVPSTLSPSPVEAEAQPALAAVPASVSPAVSSQKRRLAVMPFDYSAVKSAVTFWFKNDVNIGEGIRAMLVARLGRTGTISLVERSKVDVLLKEQDFGASNRVDQGSRARIGRISGADAMLLGDIVIFGRDDVKKKGFWGGVIDEMGGGVWSSFSKEEKAVVAINFRIVDSETLEVIQTGEARGESSRKSKDWGALLGTKKGVGAAGTSMQSSNFEETIIGEATMAAVSKLADELNSRIPALPKKAIKIDARVATAMPDGTLYLNVGADEGVQVGDRFEIQKIVGEVVDPVTKAVLDQQTEKVGELTVRTVREKVTIGSYVGPTINLAAAKGFAARKIE